jgi:hypothetical protein
MSASPFDDLVSMPRSKTPSTAPARAAAAVTMKQVCYCQAYRANHPDGGQQRTPGRGAVPGKLPPLLA